MSAYIKNKGEYGFNIDSDVALWLDSRAFLKKPSLRKACGFVILNAELHKEFDEFKKAHCVYDYDLLEYVELLKCWSLSLKAENRPPIIHKFGKNYIKLCSTDIDVLCRWASDLKEQFDNVRRAALEVYVQASHQCTPFVRSNEQRKRSLFPTSQHKNQKKVRISSRNSPPTSPIKICSCDEEEMYEDHGSLTWLTIGDVTLTQKDKDDILNGGCLSDAVIYAAEVLIKNDPNLLPVNSLQNPILGTILAFQEVGEESVQILHSGGNHWVTISTVGLDVPSVRIYDSLHSQLPASTTRQIAALLRMPEEDLQLQYANTQVWLIQLFMVSKVINIAT